MKEWIKNTNIDLIVVIFLGITLFWAVLNQDQQLSQNIATGLIGYIGGRKMQ